MPIFQIKVGKEKIIFIASRRPQIKRLTEQALRSSDIKAVIINEGPNDKKPLFVLEGQLKLPLNFK